jgi:hypothetical protein
MAVTRKKGKRCVSGTCIINIIIIIIIIIIIMIILITIIIISCGLFHNAVCIADVCDFITYVVEQPLHDGLQRVWKVSVVVELRCCRDIYQEELR